MLSVAIALDVSSSDTRYKVPVIDLEAILEPLVIYMASHGGGLQLSITHISKFSNTSPARIVFEQRPPLPPVEPSLDAAGNIYTYHLAKRTYEDELLPTYIKDDSIYTSTSVKKLSANGPLSKDELRTLTHQLLTESQSIQEFYNKVTEAGHPVYEHNGKPMGVQFSTEDGLRKMRFNRLGLSEPLEDLAKHEQLIQDQLQELDELRSEGADRFTEREI